ncbi:hypothetical protein D6D13_02523 [Aureobasidium pullulans]|uniref:Uncharacterized protein n=1 Tax=Aureobasidium pullulans TaxID=5580 RepID=A0A4S9D4L2_AURPU|nr:hypothetical protein D6D13_02523 [Aureobasidium pullulans]
MVEEYVREQRVWLGQLYPKHGDRLVVPPTERVLDPQSPQWQIAQILQDLLESGIGGEEAAQRLADVILPSTDAETLYDNLWGCFFNAVESFSDFQTLTTLSDLLASLARAPNAVNDEAIEQKTMQADSSIVATSPGHKQFGHNQHLWHDLSLLSINITERMQGPETHLCHNEPPKVAARKWKNMNSFLAILIRDHATISPNLFGNRIWHAFDTLAMALEHPPKSRLGRNMILHLPAAYAWICLARDTVWEAVEVGEEERRWTASAGQLWRDRDGTSVVDERRWTFWKWRLEDVRKDSRIDGELADMLLQASKLM